MSKKDLLSQCREALGDATLTNLDLLNLIGEMKIADTPVLKYTTASAVTE